jgi:hypothetical protein
LRAQGGAPVPPEPQAQIAQQKLSRPAALFMGLLCFTCGAAVLAAATGVLPAAPGTLQAPRWVIGCAGVVFLAGSLLPLNAACGLPNWLNQLAGLAVALGLALVLNWIAFFPGERHFSGTFSVPGVTLAAGANAIAGRIMFGLGALLADAIVLGGLWRQLRRARAPGPPAAGDQPKS